MEVEDTQNDITIIITPQLGIRHYKIEDKQFEGSYKDLWAAVESGIQVKSNRYSLGRKH